MVPGIARADSTPYLKGSTMAAARSCSKKVGPRGARHEGTWRTWRRWHWLRFPREGPARFGKIAPATGWDSEFVTLAEGMHAGAFGAARQLRGALGADSTRIRRELGYREPVSPDEAMQRTIDWERAHPPGEFNPRSLTSPPKTPQ